MTQRNKVSFSLWWSLGTTAWLVMLMKSLNINTAFLTHSSGTWKNPLASAQEKAGANRHTVGIRHWRKKNWLFTTGIGSCLNMIFALPCAILAGSSELNWFNILASLHCPLSPDGVASCFGALLAQWSHRGVGSNVPYTRRASWSSKNQELFDRDRLPLSQAKWHMLFLVESTWQNGKP